jgi:hypothetical protein
VRPSTTALRSLPRRTPAGDQSFPDRQGRPDLLLGVRDAADRFQDGRVRLVGVGQVAPESDVIGLGLEQLTLDVQGLLRQPALKRPEGE